MVVSLQLLYIFKNKNIRSLFLQDTGNFKKERTSHVIESQPVAYDTERLAGESSQQDIMVRYVISFDLRNISFGNHMVVGIISPFRFFVYLTGKKAFPSKVIRSLVKTANSRKQVNIGKTHRPHILSASRFVYIE